MSTLYFDIWAPGSINGAAVGELTSAKNRQFRKAHLTVGSGQFTINRHDAQAAWVVPRSLVRVRFVTGGPFAYNDARYKFAFWIEESSDVALSEEEEGGEDLTRGGRSEVAILQRAILYPTADDERDTAHANKVSETGNWKFKNRTPGEVLSIFLRNAEARTPNPLAPLTRDFGIVQDSTNTDWPDVNTDWQIPVGTNGLELLDQLTSAGVYWRIGPDLIFHAYEVEPGVNLSATITLAKGVDLESAAEKQIHASPAMSRVIVHGVRENNTMKYREVINSTVETAIGRIEGFVEYKRTPTNSRLDRAGNRAIRKAKNQYDGPTTVQVLDATGRTALVDYQPGDTVTINIPGVFDSEAVRVAAVSYEENEVGEADPVLELIASPFDPASGDGLSESGGGNGGGGGGGGKGGCGDCPEPVPFVPAPSGTCAGPVVLLTGLSVTVGGTHPPNSGSPSAAVDGNWNTVSGYSGMVGLDGPVTHTTWWDVTIPSNMLVHRLEWTYGYGDNSDQTGPGNGLGADPVNEVSPGGTWAGSQYFNSAGTGPWMEGDGPHPNVHVIDYGDAPVPATTLRFSSSRFYPGFYYDNGATLADVIAYGCVIGTSTPNDGQPTTEQIAGHAAYTDYTTNYPYAPGSLVVQVDGVYVTPIEIDPTAGTFQLGFDATGKTVVVSYQIMSSTPTGANNPQPTPTPSLPPDVQNSGHWENVTHQEELVFENGDIVVQWVP